MKEPKNDIDMGEFQRSMSAVGIPVIIIDDDFKFPTKEEVEAAEQAGRRQYDEER